MNADSTEIFRRAMMPYGGRVEFEKGAGTPAGEAYAFLAKAARGLIEDARRIVPRLPPIHFEFVATGLVNAFAFKESERYFIGITSGAAFMLQLIFSRMLRERLILPHIADPALEGENLSPIEIVTNADVMEKTGIIPVLPNSVGRAEYSQYLWERATMFLLGHEIAHISLGHVDYLASHSKSRLIAELGWTAEDEDSTLERQTLEMNADYRSVAAGIASVRRTAQLMAAHPPPPWSATPLTIQHLLFDWSFAVNSLFRLFGDVRFSGTHAQVAAHPPLPIRRMMVAVTADKLTQSEADQTMESNLGKPGTNWVHTFRKAILETELAFMMITGQERSGFGLQDVFSRDGIDYANRLWSLWHGTMSGRLRPYSYEAHRPAVQ